MSEGSNVLRLVKNRSWLYNELATLTIRCLIESLNQHFNRIFDDATAERVRKALDVHDFRESLHETEHDIYAITEREFEFGELDTSVLPVAEGEKGQTKLCALKSGMRLLSIV